MHILAFGLNHKTAPVEIREQLSLGAAAQAQALHGLRGDYDVGEAAVVATCNRSEFYLALPHAGTTPVRRFLTERLKLDMDALHACFYALHDQQAADHLFRVACGIDSLVVGESQILAQVREALERAQECGTAGILLNELFQRALRVGKRARTETDIGRGRLSIGTAAVELAAQVFDDLSRCTVLLLGAGEMGELIAQYLMHADVRTLLVANRTPARAQELARRVQGHAIPFAEMAAQLSAVDIVITTTAAPGFVIGAEALRTTMRVRRGRPLFLIDIAVPRDVEPAARDLDNVFVFDIDDLEQVVTANRSERENEIHRVEKLVDEEVKAFGHWRNALDAAPLIRALHAHAEELRAVELERWGHRVAQLDSADRELLERVLRGYANKLLHLPVVQIRELANTPDGPARLDTVRRLFGLRDHGDATTEEER